MGTGGIAAGGSEVMEAFKKQLDKKDIQGRYCQKLFYAQSRLQRPVRKGCPR